MLDNPNDPRHGTYNGYTYHGCRCSLCREANRIEHRRQREKRHAKLKPEDHGKATTYVNSDCRCVPCTEAWRIYRTTERKGLARTL